jgi:hypothetical protein
MAWALIEGLAGVVDRGRTFDVVTLSPRWAAAGVTEADVSVGYAASGAGVSYAYLQEGARLTLDIRHPGGEVACHVLLPPGLRATGVRVDGRAMSHTDVQVEASRYVDVPMHVAGASRLEIEIGPA